MLSISLTYLANDEDKETVKETSFFSSFPLDHSPETFLEVERFVLNCLNEHNINVGNVKRKEFISLFIPYERGDLNIELVDNNQIKFSFYRISGSDSVTKRKLKRDIEGFKEYEKLGLDWLASKHVKTGERRHKEMLSYSLLLERGDLYIEVEL